MSAGEEIERKFLIERAPAGLDACVRSEIDQGYLASDPTDSTEVRLRRKGDKRFLTIKRGTGLQRLEREVSLDEKQFETLWPLTEGARLQKTRYLVPSSEGAIELDVYRGALEGLIVAEVEFDSRSQADAYAPPGWFGREVTNETGYGNRALARLTADDARQLVQRVQAVARQCQGTTKTSLETDWVTRWGRGEPERRLICFPHAGASGATFRAWAQHAPEGVEVCAIEAPGRFGRSQEEPFRSMGAFIDALDEALHGLLDRPYALFGHSLGALMAFEWVLRARKLGRRMPEQLIVAACGAPTEERRRALSDLPEERFLEAIERRYGPVEPALRSDPEVLTFILRVMRADLEMLETYRCGGDAMIDVPIVALAGSDDRTVLPKSVEEWARRTTSSFQMQTFPGGHFFLRERSAEITSLVFRFMGTRSRVPQAEPSLT